MSPAKVIEKIEGKIENAMTTATSVLLSPKPGTSSSFKSATIPVSSPRKSPENICTVDTVNDLKNAQILLESSEEDIQIVVANDLLQTSEYKTFMSHLNLPPNDDREILSNHIPPKTPMTTRPPSSTTAEPMDWTEMPPPKPNISAIETVVLNNVADSNQR